MRVAVVCYSLQGGTYGAAKDAADALGADLVRLEPAKPYPTKTASMYFWCGKSAVFREAPRLAPYRFEGEYDAVVLATPIWAGTFAPPLRTFLRQNRGRIRKAALLACCGGGEADKCFAGIAREIPGVPVLGRLRLVLPDPGSGNAEAVARVCARIRDARGADETH